MNFELTVSDFTKQSSFEKFVLLKNKAFLDSYQKLFATIATRKILEVGLFHGGNVVFYDLLLNPEKFVCIDQIQELQYLRHYIESRHRSNIVPHLGIDQADNAALDRILGHEFPGRDIDLVIDDASHMYHPSRASFEAVFPYVRVGGTYVVEDWGWAHWPGEWQQPNGPMPGPALSNLIFELVMVAATRPDIISEIHVDLYRVAVQRGPADLSTAPFCVHDAYLARGRKLELI